METNGNEQLLKLVGIEGDLKEAMRMAASSPTGRLCQLL